MGAWVEEEDERERQSNGVAISSQMNGPFKSQLQLADGCLFQEV